MNNFHLGIGEGDFQDTNDPRNDIDYFLYINYDSAAPTDTDEWNAVIKGNTENPNGYFKSYPHKPFVTNTTHGSSNPGKPGNYNAVDIFKIRIQNGYISFWKKNVSGVWEELWAPTQSGTALDFVNNNYYLMGTMFRTGSGVKNIEISYP